MPAIGWDDIAGMPDVKTSVMEVVDVLQRPELYARLGARCPRGILLAGPPGTGKTLLARAVAGEAGVPFLCCTGSDFVEVCTTCGMDLPLDSALTPVTGPVE